MITALAHRKLMVLSFAFAMVFMIARILTVIGRFPEGDMLRRAAVSVTPNHVIQRVSEKLPLKKIKVLPKVDANFVRLNSNLREFTITFSGQVRCSGQPCQADLDIKMTTVRNENLHRVIKTLEDGNFWIQLPVTEIMNEHVDWKIMARGIDGKTVETRGREILNDDSPLSIDTTLALP